MLGAIMGDMIGSIFEFSSKKINKDFEIFDSRMHMTDDSLLTIAVAKVLMAHYPITYDENEIKLIKSELVFEFVNTWRENMNAGFGGMFYRWCQNVMRKQSIEPYNSFGNGSAMRISPVGWMAKSEDEVKKLSKIVTEITHNHPEGIKGAESIAMCIYLALHGATKDEIKDKMIKDYYPEIANLDYRELVLDYLFNATCQGSVPQAIYCFLISESLEDAIRNCVAIGGDADTIGAMAGSIAEAYYQKDNLSTFEKDYLYLMVDPEIEKIVKDFHNTIGSEKFAS